MSAHFPDSLCSHLAQSGVISVVILNEPEKAVSLAQALVNGGIRAMELTLRTPTALEALRRIRDEVPSMVVGAGTILRPSQVDEAIAAGAQFGVAPGSNPRVFAAAADSGLPFATGVCTPTDIEKALELGVNVMKFFPAEPCGGLAYLRAIAAPFTHLGVKFIPLGGIHLGNARCYLDEPAVLAVGGSWLAPKELIAGNDWNGITRLAAAASQLKKPNT